MRAAEFSIGFAGAGRLITAPASLARRERLALYSLIYGLAPRFALEVGSFRGGSAAIICAALHDVDTGGRLLCIDPDMSRIDRAVRAELRDVATIHEGFFPSEMPAAFHGQSIRGLFEVCFYDAVHTYEGVLHHLQDLVAFMTPGAFIICHDGYNLDQARGMSEAAKLAGLIDCGMITRCANDNCDPTQIYGGMRLFRVPGELPPNS